MRGRAHLPVGPRPDAPSIDQVAVGAVVWAYARHYWREVRIVAKARTLVTVAYWIHDGGSLVTQRLQVWNLRYEKPQRLNGSVSTPAPTRQVCGLPEGAQ